MLYTRFTNVAGEQYRFRLVARAADTVDYIDFVPQSIYEEATAMITRISDLRLKREDDYFVTSFDYKLAQDSKFVDIILNAGGAKSSTSDFVLYVYKKEE